MINPYGLIFGPSSLCRAIVATALRLERLAALGFFAIRVALPDVAIAGQSLSCPCCDYAPVPIHHSAGPWRLGFHTDGNKPSLKFHPKKCAIDLCPNRCLPQ
jgi:hypothetical protein